MRKLNKYRTSQFGYSPVLFYGKAKHYFGHVQRTPLLQSAVENACVNTCVRFNSIVIVQTAVCRALFNVPFGYKNQLLKVPSGAANRSSRTQKNLTGTVHGTDNQHP